jgi:hypothetical protein
MMRATSEMSRERKLFERWQSPGLEHDWSYPKFTAGKRLCDNEKKVYCLAKDYKDDIIIIVEYVNH